MTNRLLRAVPRAAVLFVVVALAAAPHARAEDDLAFLEESAWREAVARVADSVVRIQLVGGLNLVDGQLIEGGATTGLLISDDGYVVSSAYQFASRPSSIVVQLATGERAPAELVATDHARKIVLLKVDPSGLAAERRNEIEFLTGDEASAVQVGEWAIAVGKTSRVETPNVSVGIVSALGRMQGRAMQTDAKISSANYGGPLVDVHGRVLGLLVPMSPQSESDLAGAEWYDSGIGFAIPIEQVIASADRMKSGEDLHRGLLGVAFADGAAYRTPPTIEKVSPDSPAASAEMRQGDTILAVDEMSVRTVSQLRAALGPHYAGDTVRFTLRRGEEEITVAAKLIAELTTEVESEDAEAPADSNE